MTDFNVSPLFGAELHAPDKHTHRAVFTEEDGTLHVAKFTPGNKGAVSEFSFSPEYAVDVALGVLAGEPRVLTMPGVGRILAAALLERAHRHAEQVTAEAKVDLDKTDADQSDDTVD